MPILNELYIPGVAFAWPFSAILRICRNNQGICRKIQRFAVSGMEWAPNNLHPTISGTFLEMTRDGTCEGWAFQFLFALIEDSVVSAPRTFAVQST